MEGVDPERGSSRSEAEAREAEEAHEAWQSVCVCHRVSLAAAELLAVVERREGGAAAVNAAYDCFLNRVACAGEMEETARPTPPSLCI